MKRASNLLFGLLALMSGCSSLRPPAEDRAVWLEEQQEAQQVPTQQKDSTSILYDLASGLGSAFAR